MKEKLPPHLMKLAKKAGFCFWEDEHYGPGPDHIDWSSDYTDCLERFAELVAQRCAQVAEFVADERFPATQSIVNVTAHQAALECSGLIREFFAEDGGEFRKHLGEEE